MKQFIFSFVFALLSFWMGAQPNGQDLPEFNLEKTEVEAHLRFLASDFLKGRRTGDRGNVIAANYLKTQLEAFGVQPIPGQDDYFQPVPLQQVTPPQSGTLSWNKQEFTHGDDMLVLAGESGTIKTKAVFVNYGWVDEENGTDDYEGLDVEGKIAVSILGTEDTQSPQGIFRTTARKREIAAEKGAVALIELYRLPPTFWNNIKGYFGRARIELASEEEEDESPGIPYIWLKEGDSQFSKLLKEGKKQKLQLKSSSATTEKIQSSNVAGWIEGSDPDMKDEYVILTAHYDHVGVGRQGGGAYTAQDSIFNGARDNAFGTTALLSAAKSLSLKRPKRSVIILAVTAEEVGLLGSRYYANNPLVPLEQTIANLNTDGAGYNATDRVTVFGLGRTGVDAQIEAGASAVDLQVADDPAPEQGLFDRSDNVSFAAKGVPAPTVSPGFTAFNEEIMKYYHQVADNPDTIDFDYLLRFCKAYSHMARQIADMEEKPFWTEGDKYEEVGKELYGLD